MQYRSFVGVMLASTFHRMIHVNEDRSDPVLVSLNIRLAAISPVCNIEGQNLVFQMYHTAGCVSSMGLRLPLFPVFGPVFFLRHALRFLAGL